MYLSREWKSVKDIIARERNKKKNISIKQIYNVVDK